METSDTAPVIRSTLDVAIWFVERAESVNTYLPAMKLQQLLYLSQTYYARANKGQKLIPATFLAASAGPVEPTIYHIFEYGVDNIQIRYPEPEIEQFLLDIWEKFSGQPVETLKAVVRGDVYYRRAYRHGRNHEILIPNLHLIDEDQDYGLSKKLKRRKPKQVGISTSGKRATKWVPGSYGRRGNRKKKPTKPWVP